MVVEVQHVSVVLNVAVRGDPDDARTFLHVGLQIDGLCGLAVVLCFSPGKFGRRGNCRGFHR